MYTNLITIAIFILIISLYFFSKKRKKKNHVFNISRSKLILKKINTFEHDGQKINYLKKINPFIFEELILTAFEKDGFSIIRNKKYTGDGGLDGIVYKNKNDRFLIQSKRYSSYVNRKDILDFETLVKKKKYTGGYFCHTGKTGKETYRFFLQKNIEIISGDKLLKLLTLEN